MSGDPKVGEPPNGVEPSLPGATSEAPSSEPLLPAAQGAKSTSSAVAPRKASPPTATSSKRTVEFSSSAPSKPGVTLIGMKDRKDATEVPLVKASRGFAVDTIAKKSAEAVGSGSNNADLLPPCTVWVGNLPIEQANDETVLQIFGHENVSRVTVRPKPSKEGDDSNKSWAFVTLLDAETVVRVLENPIFVKNDRGMRVQLRTQLPKQGPRDPNGATAEVIARHRARGMWRKIAKQTNHKTANTVMIPTAASAILKESVKRGRAMKRRCFFLPNSKFSQFWDLGNVLALLYVAVVYPVNEGFGYEAEVWTAMFWVDLFVDSWFIIDLFVNFRTAFIYNEGRTRGVIEINQGVISRRYLRGWFTIDFISCLPVNYLQYLNDDKPVETPLDQLCAVQIGDANDGMVFNPKFLKVLRLMRLSRLLRLAKFTKLMENYEDTSIRDWLESTRVFMFGVFILWTTHILACIWYYTGTLNQQVGTGGNASVTIFGWVCHDFETKMYGAAESERYSLQHVSAMRRYLVAFHAVNAKMFDMKENHDGDFTDGMLLVAIILELLGVLIFGVLVGKLSQFMLSGRVGEQQYHDTMDSLREFFRHKLIPFGTRRKVRMFYDNLYANKIVFDEKKLLAPLPPHLSQEVVFQMYHDIIQNTPLFSGLENEVITKLCINMKPYHVMAGTTIMREGEVGHEMYLVVSGEVLISKGDEKIAIVRMGATLGELALLQAGAGARGTHRSRTATAVTDCDMCFLTRQVLLGLMDDYPSLEEQLEKLKANQIREDGWEVRRSTSFPQLSEEGEKADSPGGGGGGAFGEQRADTSLKSNAEHAEDMAMAGGRKHVFTENDTPGNTVKGDQVDMRRNWRSSPMRKGSLKNFGEHAYGAGGEGEILRAMEDLRSEQLANRKIQETMMKRMGEMQAAVQALAGPGGMRQRRGPREENL